MFFGPGYIQRCMFAFVICTILSLLLEGAWLGSTDYGTMHTLTWFTSQSVKGVFGIPLAIPLGAVGFLASLPQMLVWDYSFFNSLGAFGALIRVVLSVTISIGFVWGFMTMLWPIIANFVATILRGALSFLGIR